ncbi:anti-anti-sigma factor [Shinella sp. BE166]|uniref:Anti-sigma factor antagonist n=1 Tax=Shinella lacus TaxID=2654216 RepID=A0ABT1R111_9HYPH|nr:STAS domain-containing protein [Shinella lacus]MCQ4628858.1 STAS domain-containing protein [Shinella lacus]
MRDKGFIRHCHHVVTPKRFKKPSGKSYNFLKSSRHKVINRKPEVNIIMNIAETRQANSLVVAPTGRIDSQTSPVFDRHLSAIIERGDVNLIIDLAGLEYISSTGLSAFLSAAKKVRAAGGRMSLTGLNSRIRLVFEMSGFLRLFPIYANVDAALSG